MRRFALAGIGFYLTPQVAWSLFVCPEVFWHLLETAFHFRPDATSGSSSVANRPRFTPLSQKSSHVTKMFPFFSRAHFNHLQRQKGFTSIMYLLSDCPPRPGSLGCQATAAQATPPSTWTPSQRAPPPTELLHRSPSRSLSAPLLRSVSSSPTGTQQQAAAAAAMLLDGARRAAPGALRPPPLRIWGAWASIQAQAPKF